MGIKTITMEEVNKLPPLSKKEIEKIKKFDEKFDDPECLPLSKEKLNSLQSASLVHPEWYKVKKADIHLRIDVDVLEAIKSKGKGYQTRINSVLRTAVMNGML